jgi:hypothetical protein
LGGELLSGLIGRRGDLVGHEALHVVLQAPALAPHGHPSSLKSILQLIPGEGRGRDVRYVLARNRGEALDPLPDTVWQVDAASVS